MGKYYLYRHIRLDTGEPFYIGIGQKYKHFTSWEKEYRRAYEFKYNRTKYWKNIVNKVGYEVEILMESDDYEFILSKEKEFIKLYGRKITKEGNLVNLSEGGVRGSKGCKWSDEQKLKIREIKRKSFLLGRIPTVFKSKKIYQYNLNNIFIREWSCTKEASLHLGVSFTGIQKNLIKKSKTSGGFIWKYLKEY